MQHLTKAILLVLLCNFSNTLLGQTLTFHPTHPLPTETITITYQPEDNNEKTVDGIQMVAYLFEEDALRAISPQELYWKKVGEQYVAHVITDIKTTGLLIRILPAHSIYTDANDGEGYDLIFYNDDRKTPKKQALAAKAAMRTYYPNRKGVRKNLIEADSLFNKEFEIYPISKSNPFVYRVFLFHKLKQDRPAGQKLIRDWANDVCIKPNPTEAEILQCFHIFNHTWEQETERQFYKTFLKLLKRGIKLYPNSKAESLFIDTKINTETDEIKQVNYIKKLESLRANGVDNQSIIDNKLSYVAYRAAIKGGFKRAEMLISKIDSWFIVLKTYSAIAEACGGETVEERGISVKKACRFAEKAIDILDTRDALLQLSMPSYFTKTWYQSELDAYYYTTKEAYAMLLFKSKRTEEAIKIQEAICQATQFNNPKSVQRYCKYLAATGKQDKAYSALKNIIANGKSNTEMEQQFQRLYLARGHSQAEYNEEITKLKKAGNLRLALTLSEKMIEEPAPPFKLKNLLGEYVSLENLRGKVVVLDFWANWCGACKASFPAMQQLVNHYADQKDIVFLFVDTWAQNSNKIAQSVDYILNSGYNFEVIVDKHSKMADNFQIKSIPTKIVIDRTGNIRFISNSFENDETQMVKELSMMIELVAR